MITYKNKLYRFEIELPDGWSVPGYFRRLFGGEKNPIFYGGYPKELGITVFEAPPSAYNIDRQKRALEETVAKMGGDEPFLGTIKVCGREHATATYTEPFQKSHPISMRFVRRVKRKIYNLVFEENLYIAAAALNIIPDQADTLSQIRNEEELDKIVKSFRKI